MEMAPIRMGLDEKCPRGEQMLKTVAGRLMMVSGLGVLMIAPLVYDFFTKPESLKPFVGVFGANPLGIPTPVASSLVFAAIVAPLVGMMWRGIELVLVLKQLEGRAVTGKFAIVAAAWRNWAQPLVRLHARAMLGWLGLFVLMVGAWIIATEMAGV